MTFPMEPADKPKKDPDTPSNRVARLPIIEADPAGETGVPMRDWLVQQEKLRLPPRWHCLESHVRPTVLTGEGPRSDWWHESITGPARLAAATRWLKQGPREGEYHRRDEATVVGIKHRSQDLKAMTPTDRVTGTIVETSCSRTVQ